MKYLVIATKSHNHKLTEVRNFQRGQQFYTAGASLAMHQHAVSLILLECYLRGRQTATSPCMPSVEGCWNCVCCKSGGYWNCVRSKPGMVPAQQVQVTITVLCVHKVTVTQGSVMLCCNTTNRMFECAILLLPGPEKKAAAPVMKAMVFKPKRRRQPEPEPAPEAQESALGETPASGTRCMQLKPQFSPYVGLFVQALTVI